MATAGMEPSGSIGSSTATRKMASTEVLSTSSTLTMKKTIGHRGIDPTGETTYKKTPSSALKGAIQLGITHTVGSLTQKPERDVLMQDFEVVESIFFPGEGSNLTPAHHYSDFRFKTYAPIAFRYFREMFGIRPDDYLYSLCNEPLIELSNSGASGSIFYVSSDDEFIIKTVQHKEAEFLQKLLPGYFMTLNQNKRTLLPKFYGLYCVQAGGKNIRIIVMNNLLPRSIKWHLKYDLKGSTHKRRASAKERDKAMPTYKDLDFVQDMPDGLLLEADKYNALSKTIQRDCRMLQSFKIMDYSLLVVVHNLEQAGLEQAGEDTVDQRRPPQAQKSLYCTAIEAIQGEARGMGSLDTSPEDQMGGIPAQNSKGERLLVYIGIIDILQSYRLAKKIEHSWKALVHDGDTVSVHRPGFYAERFQKFMCNTVFRKILLKTSPTKKVRVGVHMSQRRPNAAPAGGPGQSIGPAVHQSISMEKDPEAEDGGIQSGRPDLLPKTSTHTAVTSKAAETTLSNTVDSTFSNSVETTLSSPCVRNSELAPTNQASDTCTSLGEEANERALANQASPPFSDTRTSLGEEANELASTDQELSAIKSVDSESLEDSTESPDVISLNDIVPHTKCQV